jgi:alpha-L-fucosidase
MVRQLQPGAVIFSDEGPDVRWIGNERGFAGETNWSTMDRSKVSVGAHGIQEYLNTGEEAGPDWVPGECDTSIRRGWFWHAAEEPKSLEQLLEIYFKSVGRNCVLLLNVPPNTDGRLDDADVQRLREFKDAIDRIFAEDLAEGALASAEQIRGDDPSFGPDQALDGDLDTYWAGNFAEGSITLDLGSSKTFNVIRLQEPISMGQRVAAYRVDVREGGAWKTVSRGSTIGYKKLDRLEAAGTADRVRIVIERALAVPLIAEVGFHFDPYAASP